MRTLPWLLVALVVGLTLAVPVPGQGQDAPQLRVAEDRPGDVAWSGSPAPLAMPAGTADDIDLVSLDVSETPQDFLITLGVKDMASGSASVLASSRQVFFRHHDQDYGIRFYATSGGGGSAYLEAYEPGETFGAYVADLPLAIDAGASTMTATVRRDLLTDNDGALPHPGRILDNFQAESSYFGIIRINGASAPQPSDRMPDDGVGALAWPVQYGIQQSGQLRLSSDEPFRSSNGEASTFVFRVNATNLAPQEDLVEFVATGVPTGWDIQLPGLARLEANQSVEFPVIVRTTFAHQHGSATAITLELVSQRDANSVGRIQLGLRYPLIAQPAGHHDQLFLHSIDGSQDTARLAIDTVLKLVQGGDFGKQGYFNTASPDEDPQDDGVPITGYECQSLSGQDGDAVGTAYCWEMPLGPGLQMGLDFDLNRTGTYTIPISSLLPQPGARIEGELVYYPPWDGEQFDPETGFVERSDIVVAVLEPSERFELGAQGTHTFTGIVTPTEDGDYLPYLPGAGLALQLRLVNARVDNPLLGPKGEPDLLPGGSLSLPLFDYEDRIGEAFSDGAKLHLSLEGAMQRLGNPGDTLLFNATLTNNDNQTHTLALLVIGSNREWATLPGGPEIRLRSNESVTIPIAVLLPLGALDEERADLVLDVASTSDLAARALVRVVATVDTDAEHADDALQAADAAEQAAKDTPAPAALWLGLLLGALALAKRRR